MKSEPGISYWALTQWPAGRARTKDDARHDANFRRAGGSDGTGVYRGPQRTPLSTTLDDLVRELSMIGVSDAVVQLDVRGEREFRVDGTGPRADAKVNSPAVVVSFTRTAVPYVFACDHFERWEDNLRAIALGLEGLRRLERYHIGQAGEQYRGWQALPASTTTTALSTEAAAAVIARRSDGYGADVVLGARSTAREAYRSAASRVHPDRGGSTEEFQLVQEAMRVLEAHFGASL